MRNDSVICLGVGDGWPSADRNHSAYVYRLGNACFVLDAGEPVCRAYKLSGLSFDAPEAIVLSHLHADHFGGLLMLLQGMWVEGRTKPLRLYLPAHALEPVRAVLKEATLYQPLLPYKLHLRPLRAGKPIRIGEVKITPFESTHLVELEKRRGLKPTRRLVSYLFLIESRGLRIGHSSDLGSPDDLRVLLDKPLDLLICELAHFTPQQVCAVLSGQKIKRVAFVHLARSYWSALPATRKLLARLLPDIPHCVPSDGEVITLG
ncbi:MAG: MBL fold metallo-hydrolase [Verrucomicrobiae bacterium]|nr:MBL fold metallo-hydrolase [Verrucomicrobiae bacterium]